MEEKRDIDKLLDHIEADPDAYQMDVGFELQYLRHRSEKAVYIYWCVGEKDWFIATPIGALEGSDLNRADLVLKNWIKRQAAIEDRKREDEAARKLSVFREALAVAIGEKERPRPRPVVSYSWGSILGRIGSS